MPPHVIRRNSASGTGPYTAAVGNWSLANFLILVTVKTAIVPSARPTYMRSPGRRARSQKKMPGPERESTCPAMMAEPTMPGRGLPVYQPATAVLDGTWSVPSLLTPRWISLVRTPIDGMLSDTGRAACGAVASEAGGTVRPVGAGIGAGRAGSGAACAEERVDTVRPVAPIPTAASPAPSAAAATSRREDRRSHGRCRDVHRLTVVPATWRQEGGDSAAAVPGSAIPAPGGSHLPRSGTVTPGDCAACQAGSHQSSGRQESAGMGPVCPLYPIVLPIPAGRPAGISG